MRQLAVFVGGFDADAATSVVPGLTVDVLSRLVDKSVVSIVPGSTGGTRYGVLETVREYARELLVAAGELDDARERHFRHFLSLGNQARDRWPSSTAPEFVERLEADYGNVRAALEWAVVADPCAGVRFFSGMLDLFQILGQADGRRLAELALERCPARDRYRVDVQISAGALAWWTGDHEAARATLAEARELSVELDERALEGWARSSRASWTCSRAQSSGRASISRRAVGCIASSASWPARPEPAQRSASPSCSRAIASVPGGWSRTLLRWRLPPETASRRGSAIPTWA